MATVKTAHTTSSIRARSRAAPARPDASAPDRKVVYKPVIDNPLNVHWPPLPASVRNEILKQLVQLVQGPPLLSELVVGINQVTRALESRIRWDRWELGDSHAAPPASLPVRGVDETNGGIEVEQPEAARGRGASRKRKRKHHASSSSWSSAAAAAVPSASVPALPLGDHPAYSFLHGARTAPSRDVLPPYFCLDQSSESLATSSSSSPRILVNSDARRLVPRAGKGTGENDDKKKNPRRKKTKQSAGTTLLPAHPGVASIAANTGNDGVNAVAISDGETGSPPPPPPPPTVPLVDLVFVCKPDINPPSLVAHLPTMVAAANGVQTALDSVLQGEHEHGAGPVGAEAEAAERMQLDAAGPEEREKQPRPKRPEMRPVLLIPLDLGAERKLADALGLRRVAAIAVSSLLPAASALYSLLQSHKLQPLSTPWLVPYLLHPHAPARQQQGERESSLSRFAPTTIKHVKTSAPLNPKAGVQQRKEARKEKKDAIVEMKRKKRRLAIEKAHAHGGCGGSAYGNDVYVAED